MSGMFILAFGMYNIHSRCAISEGGVLGLTLLLKEWFHISPGITSFFIDTSLFILGEFILGKGFLKKSIFASVSYSSFYLIFEHFGPVLPDLSDHLLIASVTGAVFVGIGAGLAVNQRCAAGGDDALALILNRKCSFRISSVYLVSDLIVLVLSLSYIPLKDILYSLLSVILSGQIIDKMYKEH